MLKFNKKTEYGLMALKYLAQETDGAPASARDIADCYSIPYPLLAKVLHKLAAEGLVQSQQGSNGGYVLLRNLTEVNVADVVTALEGPWATVDCADLSAVEPCALLESCTIIDPMTRLNGQIISFLQRVPVIDIIGSTEGPELYDDQGPPPTPAGAFGAEGASLS